MSTENESEHMIITPKKSLDFKRPSGIPTSRVLNTEYLNSLGEIYKCNICFNIMINPTDCESCGHSYCLECITKLKCPYCEFTNVKPSSMGIRILLNSIIFKCENEECEEKLNYNTIIHHDQECEYKPIKCPTPNCMKNIPKKNLEKHIKEDCKFIKEICKFCSSEFYRHEIGEHQESCEIVYKSLNTDSNAEHEHSEKKPTNNQKFLEALNINIAKIVKENEIKYKNLEKENIKIKNDITAGVQNFFEKLKDELKNELKPIHEEKQESKVDSENILKIESNLKDEISQLFQINLNELFLNKIKDSLDRNSEIIKDSLNNFENKIGESFRNIEIPQTNNDEKLLEGIIISMKDMVKDFEKNINQNLKTNSQSKQIEINGKNNDNENYVKLDDVNSKLDGIAKNLSEILKNSITHSKNILELLTKEEMRNFNQIENKFDVRSNSSEDDKSDANKLMQDFIKSVIEIVEVKNENLGEFVENELKKVNDNIGKQLNLLNEEIEAIKEEIKSINGKTKELKNMISEEFSDLGNNILNEMNDNSVFMDKINSISDKLTTLIEEKKNKSDEEKIPNIDEKIQIDNEKNEEIETTKNTYTEILEKITNLENKLELMISDPKESEVEIGKKVFANELDEKLNQLEKRILVKFDNRLKEMYNLKWCNECEKVDYFFGFIRCEICIKENCKQCVMLCKNCKHLYCKRCVQCPKCNDLSCLNCRQPCTFCSISKGDKFCQSCIKECQYCHKSTCQDCVKQCQSCKNMSCNDCSKFCRICNKSSCRKCETSHNFKTCYYCHQTSCIECIVVCKSCDLEICKNCFLSCKRCKKLICKKCGIECAMCVDSYCGACSKEFQQNKCFICKKIFCTGCVKNFRKCKVCKEAACKNCHANCKKCKNYFCNTCNLNCDNCDDFTCSSCVYKCVCDKFVFCEKCLLDVNPTGPHNCVLWMNDSPDFTGIKSRSKLPLPKNFEAKLYLEKFNSDTLLIGITDNNSFNEDTVSFVDNIWAFKVKTGQKYSTKKSLEFYYEKETRERDFVIVAVKNDNLYFRVNFDDNPPAFTIPANREYFLYVENDSQGFNNVKVKFIYIRKI